MRSAHARFVLLWLLAVSAAGCGGRKIVPLGVPDLAQRDSLILTSDSAARTDSAKAGAARAACLFRAGDIENCRQNLPCNVKKTQAELAAELLPAFNAVKDLDFTSGERARNAIKLALADGQTTFEVSDARRTQKCSDWGAGACMAVRYGDVWLLLGRGLAGSRVERVDIFLARQTCATKPMGGD